MITLALSAIIVVAGGIAAAIFIRMDLRLHVERIASTRLGRPVTMQSLSVRRGNPIALEVTGLRIANPSWDSSSDIITIGLIRAEIALWPLLIGEVYLDRIGIEDPRIVLEHDIDGTGNWVLPPHGTSHGTAGPSTGPIHFIGNMKVQGGELTFRTTKRHLLRVLVTEASVQAYDETAPITLRAEGSYNDLPLSIVTTLESFHALRQLPRPLAVEIVVKAQLTTINLAGTMTDPLGFDGIKAMVTVAADTLQEVSATLGTSALDNGSLTLSGMLDKHGDRWIWSDLSGRFNDAAVTGTIGLDEGRRGQPDHFDIRLGFGSLDLQRLGSASLTNPRQKGFPLQIDEDPGETYAIRVDLKEATYRRYRFDTVNIQAVVDKSGFNLNGASFGIADGRVDLSGTAEPAGAGAHVLMQGRVSDINASQLLNIAGSDGSTLSGRISAGATLEITGKTVLDGLSASNGHLALSMTGGSVSRQFLEHVSTDMRLLLRKAEGYASVRCLLTVASMHNGIISVAPLRLKTSEGNLFGGGQVDLRRDAINLALQSEGQSTQFLALDIPLHITGNFANPLVRPSTGSAGADLELAGADNLRRLPPGLRRLIAGRC